MPGLVLALALVLGALAANDEGFAAPGDTAAAVSDSVDFWLDLLQAEGAVVDSLLAAMDAAQGPPPAPTGWAWSGAMATGYDAYVQTYSLALDDTTETLAEYELVLSALGETRGAADHAWRLAPLLALGSERVRKELEAGWTWRPDRGDARLDLKADLADVRYRGTTDWNLSSDRREADLDLRWRVTGERLGTDVRLDASALRHDAPSELEVDRDDVRAMIALRSGRGADDPWKLGLRAGRRVHPDTSAIDRTMWGAEAEYEHRSFDGPSLRLVGRSERREVRDETARPSSWSHWAAADGSAPVSAALDLELELDAEVWAYDRSEGAYRDQRRWSGLAGLRASPFDGPGWQLGLAVERLDSDDPDETYTQRGVRAGLESFGSVLTASTTLEVGRRDYEADTGETPPAADLASGYLEEPVYTDFTYVELWLSASLRLSERLSLDALGSWLPESHRDDEDDQSLGFGSVQLTYRF
jgi:hypothetical protein